MTRLDDWFSRVHFPSRAEASLGWGYEYWHLDPTRYEGHAELKIKGSALGRRWTKRQLAYRFVDHLLDDVMAAAGGVEHSIVAIRSAVAEAQEWSDEHAAPVQPGVPHGIGHPSVIRAWYEFANVLSWARAVEERLDRPEPWARRGSPKLPRQGLINAVKYVRLKKRLDNLLADLRNGPLAETRLLANFTLHAALMSNPHSGARLTSTGKVYLPIPDKTVSPIAHVDLFSWNENRDAIDFAEQLWASIEEFIDNVLEAFEKAVPKRFRV
jgi:hypothetical protein